MSSVSFSFNIGALPVAYQSAFLTRLFQLNLEFQVLTAPVPPSPPAESLPMPDFAAVEGDVPAPVKKRKNPWDALSEEQKAERLAKLAAGRAAKKARKMSEDSLSDSVESAAPQEAGPEPPASADVAPQEAAPEAPASVEAPKKARKNPWASYTPEQKAARLAKMEAARLAKIAAKTAAAAEAAEDSA